MSHLLIYIHFVTQTQVHRLKAQMEKMEDAESEVASSRVESDMVRK